MADLNHLIYLEQTVAGDALSADSEWQPQTAPEWDVPQVPA